MAEASDFKLGLQLEFVHSTKNLQFPLCDFCNEWKRQVQIWHTVWIYLVPLQKPTQEPSP